MLNQDAISYLLMWTYSSPRWDSSVPSPTSRMANAISPGEMELPPARNRSCDVVDHSSAVRHGMDFPPTHEAAGWKAAPGAGVYNGCIGLLIGCAADERVVRRQLLVASTGDGCRPWPQTSGSVSLPADCFQAHPAWKRRKAALW